MAELVEKLKERLVLSDVCRSFGVSLSRRGARWVGLCPWHHEKTSSFDVDDERGTFKCFGCGKQGDVLAFVQAMLRTTDFLEVLKRGCELAGLDYERERCGGRNDAAMVRARRVGDVLTAYMQLAARSWTPLAYAQALARKKYLTPDVIARWSLGVAPGLSQCLKAGMSEDDLRLVGLLRPRGGSRVSGIGFNGNGNSDPKPETQNPDVREYMFFENSIIIPHLKNGRCVYLADRLLADTGWRFEHKKKILNMSAPGADGTGGVAMPASFNREALWDPRARDLGVLLVEARLDAIACTERGHPAVAFLSSPTKAFCEEVSSAKARLYCCFDGTPDVTALKRAEGASGLGYDCMSVRLPAGLDPDDLSHEELARVKAEAVPVVDEWFKAVEA